MRWNRTLGATMLALAIIGAVSPTLARQTPAPSEGVDVYAMTLDSTALPEGYVFEGETELNAERLAQGNQAFNVATLTDAGFQRLYVSSYLSEDESSRIRSYVSVWSSPESATAGFELLEGDDQALLADAALTDEPTEIGEEPREITSGTYSEGDTTVTTVDTTFRQGALLAGLALETLDGSPPDAEQATELAQATQARATTVLAGEAPASLDLTLPDRVLDLGSQGFPVQVGYLTGAEAETLYGPSGTALGESEGSFVTAVALGQPDAPLPLLAAGATLLADEEAAAEIVASAGDLVPSLVNGEQLDDVAVEGAESAAAFRYSNPLSEPEEQDSYRLLFSVGSTLGVVDVQGAATVEVAEQTATALAQAQAACLADDAATCELPDLPAELLPGTPPA